VSLRGVFSFALFLIKLGAVSIVSAQSGLSGMVRDSARGTPLSNVQILLTADPTPRPPAFHVLTDVKGRFHFADIPPGNYVLRARFIGFRAVNFPVEIGAGRGHSVVVRMSAVALCLGRHCEPDQSKLAYARSNRAEWGCQLAKREEVESERLSWVRRLAKYPLALPDSAGVPPQLSQDSAQLDRTIRHVTDRARCQHAGRVYDQEFGATSTHFLVYEAGPFLLVSNSGDDLVLDHAYRVLIRYVVE
jgi:hypothetical protein